MSHLEEGNVSMVSMSKCHASRSSSMRIPHLHHLLDEHLGAATLGTLLSNWCLVSSCLCINLKTILSTKRPFTRQKSSTQVYLKQTDPSSTTNISIEQTDQSWSASSTHIFYSKHHFNNISRHPPLVSILLFLMFMLTMHPLTPQSPSWCPEGSEEDPSHHLENQDFITWNVKYITYPLNISKTIGIVWFN